MSRGRYVKMPNNEEPFLGYVVEIEKPLVLKIDVYVPDPISKLYTSKGAKSVPYRFISEELGCRMYERQAFTCRLNSVEIVPSDDFTTSRIAYQTVSSFVRRTNGWVLVQLGDIDSYSRILVNIYDVVERDNLLDRLMEKTTIDGQKVVREYQRPNYGVSSPTIENISRMAYSVNSEQKEE